MQNLTPKRSFLLLAIASALLLVACGPDTLATPAPDPCPASDLVAPTHTTPATDYEIIPDLDHIFVWAYSSCEPEGWQVELAFHDPATYNQYLGGVTEIANPLPAQTSWVFDDLQAATAYEWHVAAQDSGETGPFSNTTIFWTGPICEDDALDAPTQLSPADSSSINGPEGPFFWDFAEGCVPEFTNFEIGTTPGFPGANLGSGIGPPRLITFPADPLEDCNQYFWRVRNESSSDQGPWSDVWSFSTDFEGACDEPGNSEEAGPPPTEAAAEPDGPVEGMATRDLNCREGDQSAFNESGFFASGAVAEILGKNAAETWLVVPLRLGEGNCWVAAQYVDLLDGASLEGVPVFPSPSLPATPTTPPRDTGNPPAAPENASYSWDCTSSSVTVLLAWIDGANNEDGYYIYRNGNLIATLPADSVQYTDNTTVFGQKTYTLEAFNGDGQASLQVQINAC